MSMIRVEIQVFRIKIIRDQYATSNTEKNGRITVINVLIMYMKRKY